MKIEKISVRGVVPAVMASRDTSASQVWRQSLTFERGRNYLVESASGGGKSSLCSFLYGLRTDYRGEILFNTTDISTLSIDDWCRIRRENLAFLPQEMRLFPELTAMENVTIKNTLTSAISEEEIVEMFCVLGLDDKIHRPSARLSLGEQQRVAIIRTLCQPFDFILLDEPVSHLDPENNQRAAGLIVERARALGAGIIATSVGNPININYDSILRL